MWGSHAVGGGVSMPLVIASYRHVDLLPFYIEPLKVDSYRSGSAVAQQRSLISVHIHLCVY